MRELNRRDMKAIPRRTMASKTNLANWRRRITKGTRNLAEKETRRRIWAMMAKQKWIHLEINATEVVSAMYTQVRLFTGIILQLKIPTLRDCLIFRLSSLNEIAAALHLTCLPSDGVGRDRGGESGHGSRAGRDIHSFLSRRNFISTRL